MTSEDANQSPSSETSWKGSAEQSSVWTTCPPAQVDENVSGGTSAERATFALPPDFAARLRAVLDAHTQAKDDHSPAPHDPSEVSCGDTAHASTDNLPEDLLIVPVSDATITSAKDGLVLGIPASTIIVPSPGHMQGQGDDDDDSDDIFGDACSDDIDFSSYPSNIKGNAMSGAYRGAAMSRARDAAIDTAILLNAIVDNRGANLANWVINMDSDGETVTFARPRPHDDLAGLCTPATGAMTQQLVGLRMPVQTAQALLSLQEQHEREVKDREGNREAVSAGIKAAVNASMGGGIGENSSTLSGTALSSLVGGIQLLISSQVSAYEETAGGAAKAVRRAAVVIADGGDRGCSDRPVVLGLESV